MPQVNLVPQLPPVTGEPHVKEWIVPGGGSGANAYTYYVARSLITGRNPSDTNMQPAFLMDSSAVNVHTWEGPEAYNHEAWRAYQLGVTQANARCIAYINDLLVPVDFILDGSTYAINDAIYEVETDALYDISGVAPWFRFGIGQAFGVSAAAANDFLVGFASGPIPGVTTTEAWPTIGELRCVVYGMDNTATQQVLDTFSLGQKNNEYHRYMVRLGVTASGDPFVEWLLDNVVVHSFSGAHVYNLPDNIIPGPAPMMGIGRGATVTDPFNLEWGYARGVIYRQYQTQVAPTNF